MNKLYKTLLAVSLLTIAQSNYAATATTTIAVTATVVNTCLVTATPLNFGVYASNANSDTTSTIAVTCTGANTYSLDLNAGTGAAATTTTRVMTGTPTGTLNYKVFSDTTRTTNWGTGAGNNVTGSTTGVADPKTHTAFGRVSSGQAPDAGTYADTITVTLTYN